MAGHLHGYVGTAWLPGQPAWTAGLGSGTNDSGPRECPNLAGHGPKPQMAEIAAFLARHVGFEAQ